jgi:outer membrane protein TolC
LLRVQSEQLVQRVNLYLALGGGWESEAGTSAPRQAQASPAETRAR